MKVHSREMGVVALTVVMLLLLRILRFNRRGGKVAHGVRLRGERTTAAACAIGRDTHCGKWMTGKSP